MGPIGHLSIGLAAKRKAPEVPLALLLLATMILDLLAITLTYYGIEGANGTNPWSHGLLMSLVWALLAALLATRVLHSPRAGPAVGLVVLSHWLLDLISHPIPFPSFSFRSWQWDYGHPLPPDLPLLLDGSPKVGFGLYNSISALQATALECTMFAVATAVYVRYIVERRRAGRRAAKG